MSGLTFESFTNDVRSCLAHLYDYAFLQEHPLPRLLVPETKGDASRIQSFRERIISTIETLNVPQDTLPTKQSRLYGILSLRYVQQQPLHQTLIKLNLSERQYYRDHSQGVQVLSRLLWEQLNSTETPIDISIQSELERLNSQELGEPFVVELDTLLPRTLEAVESLREKHRVQITLDISPAISVVKLDPAVLRQALIWLLSQAIIQARPGTCLTLAISVYQNQYRIVVRHPRYEPDSSYHTLLRQETLQTFVQALDGELREWTSADETGILLDIPLRENSLLLIEDNPDVIALFRRYLVAQPYQLFTAQQGDQAIQTARDLRPDLIILDVLLPKRDGWEVLLALKSQPETRHIPVLVCSVLDAAELASSLGADGFLKKPPSEEEFFRALSAYSPVALDR